LPAEEPTLGAGEASDPLPRDPPEEGVHPPPTVLLAPSPAPLGGSSQGPERPGGKERAVGERSRRARPEESRQRPADVRPMRDAAGIDPVPQLVRDGQDVESDEDPGGEPERKRDEPEEDRLSRVEPGRGQDDSEHGAGGADARDPPLVSHGPVHD